MQKPAHRAIWIGFASSAIVLMGITIAARIAKHYSDDGLAVNPKYQLAALQALADWCKWIVSIQTALIGGIVISILKGDVESRHGNVTFLVSATVCFLISIFAATALLAAIPPAMERLPIHAVNDQSRFDIYAFRYFVVDLRFLAGLQHSCFVAGMVLGLLGFTMETAKDHGIKASNNTDVSTASRPL